jgi:hypothetical protein
MSSLQVLGSQRVHWQASQFLARVTAHLSAPPVDQCDLAVLADQRQAVAESVDHLPEHGRGGARAPATPLRGMASSGVPAPAGPRMLVPGIRAAAAASSEA